MDETRLVEHWPDKNMGAYLMYVTMSDPHVAAAFPRQLSARTRKLPETQVHEGSHLFHEGDAVERVYQVVSGAFHLSRLLDDGRRQIIAFGFPGDVIGFPAGGYHHTDCAALTNAWVQPFSVSQIDSGTGDPELHNGFLKAALQEIADMQDHFMMLGRKSASERVASFLTVLASRLGKPAGNYVEFNLPMCRADIADFLGMTTETVSRTFSQLRKSRVIALDGLHTVIVLRPNALQALAEGDHD